MGAKVKVLNAFLIHVIPSFSKTILSQFQPRVSFSQDCVAWAGIQCQLGYQQYSHAALPLGLLPRMEHCNSVEEGLEQGQGCAAAFISASPGPTGEMQKPPVLSRQLFSQIRVCCTNAQMNRVSCWVLLHQFSLTAGQVLQNQDCLQKCVPEVKSLSCAIINIVHALVPCPQIQDSKQALSLE